MWPDLSYSLRMLRRSPGFSAVGVVVLALGIGATTAAFSIVNSVFFKPLAVPDPDSLVYVYSITDRAFRFPSYGAQAVRFFEGHYDKAFSGVTAHRSRSVMLGADDEAGAVRGETVAWNYFDVLGVKAQHGRTFGPEHDDSSNPSLAVVISNALWLQRFKGDPDILGKLVRLNDRMFSVIGVMPAGFVGLSNAWEPSRFWVCALQLDGLRESGLGTVARLKPGVSLEEAQAVVNVQGSQLQIEAMRETPRRNWKPTRQVVVAASSISNPSMPDQWLIEPRMLTAISVVVAIILLISTTNIAGVLSARSISRAQEVAVRQALGAGAWRLVRQLMIEALLMSIAGGLLGLALALMIVSAYQALAPTRFLVEVTFDTQVALFTLAVCIGAGIIVGLAPALQTRRVPVVATLAGGSGTRGGRRVGRRLRHAVLIPQIALSAVLLIVAGVHVRSLAEIQRMNVGYDVDGVVTMRVDHWDANRYGFDQTREDRDKRSERDRAFYRALYDRVSSVPAAGGVAVTSALPPQSWTMPGRFTSRAHFDAGDADAARADAMRVSPGYFRTMGMTLLQGRDFDARDAMTTPHVAVISEGLARQLWPAGDALGQSLAWYFPSQKTPPWWLEVVGIVNETTPVLQDVGERPMLYLNLAQTWEHYSFVVVASDPDPLGVVQRLKTAVKSADLFAEITQVRSMPQVVDEILYPRRAAALILLAGGFVGLILAAVGIYGAISHSVSQRMQEIGIRATLGADRRAILALVLREAFRVALVGVLPGMFLGLLALKVSANVVGATPTFDLATFIAVPVTVLLVILAASYVPARRASRVDPMEVLRGL